MSCLLYFLLCSSLFYFTLTDDIEENYCTTYLNSLLLLVADLHIHVVGLDKGAKFWFVVEDVEACAVEFDVGVIAGDRDVGDSDLTFMTTTKLYTSLWDVLDHHNTLTFFASSFKNHIVILRLLNRKHLDSLSIVSFDGNRKFSLADLTLKFLKIIMQSSSNDLLLNFNAYPLKKAVDVHCTAWTWAFAGIE